MPLAWHMHSVQPKKRTTAVLAVMTLCGWLALSSHSRARPREVIQTAVRALDLSLLLEVRKGKECAVLSNATSGGGMLDLIESQSSWHCQEWSMYVLEVCINVAMLENELTSSYYSKRASGKVGYRTTG